MFIFDMAFHKIRCEVSIKYHCHHQTRMFPTSDQSCYRSLANRNPLLTKYRQHTQIHESSQPFQGNSLIQNNIHVQQELHAYTQQHRMRGPNPIPSRSSVPNIGDRCPPPVQRPSSGSGKRNIDIIKDMLKPVKIQKDPTTLKETKIAVEARREAHNLFKEKNQTGIKRTNMPYKIILRDHVITKNVDEVTEADLVVHRFVDGVDNNKKVFRRELRNIMKEGKKIDEELEMEYCPENRDKHKTKFEYRQTFMTNLVYEAKTHEEGKRDYVEFYAQKQRELEEQLFDCDQLIRKLEESGMLASDELSMIGGSNPPDTLGLNDAIKALDNLDDGTITETVTSVKTHSIDKTDKRARKEDRELRRHRRELRRIERENREISKMK
jgi:hypothetical protein